MRATRGSGAERGQIPGNVRGLRAGSIERSAVVKVVLFCGGLGTRLREHSETIPKPLVPVGYRPIIWHLMRYYAHFGHKDFVLCLGYHGEMIRDYFLNYRDCMSSDFELSLPGREARLLEPGVEDWRITFVDTGIHANLGQRLRRVRHLVENEPMFLANYSDGLSDLDLASMVEDFDRSQAQASFLAVHPPHSFHAVMADDDGLVRDISPVASSGTWINGGFFCLRPSIFDVLHEGEELVEQPFRRLMDKQALRVRKHEGFWAAMDTLKDKIELDRLEARGTCPWMVWRQPTVRP
jgi:glucose-1-phosphate cytidylyltransferase